MPGLLELLGLKKPSRPEPEDIELEERGVTKEHRQALGRAAKTLTYAVKNEPDEAVRLLARLDDELKQIAKSFPLEAEELQDSVREALVDQAALARKSVTQELGHAVKDWETLKKPLVEPSASQSRERAAQLLHYINHTGEMLQRARGVIERVQKHAPKGGLDSLLPVVEELALTIPLARAAWEKLLPQRTTEGDPTPAPKVSRPQPSGVKNPKAWAEACDRVDLATAKGEAPDEKDLALMNGGASEALGAKGNPDWEADLKGRFHGSWDQVKAHFKELKKTSAEEATKFMSGYWWFRKLTVDAEMKKLADANKFQWESVGSTNLESDYDISVRTHGSKDGKTVWDYQVVTAFNKTLSARFNGVQPGTLFDTNLYASAEPPPPKVGEKTATERDMDAMAEAGQDVGALMKMRRYMSWDDYVDYQDSALAAIDKTIEQEKDKERHAVLQKRRDAALRQFETADALYFLKLVQTLKKAGIPVDPEAADSPAGQKLLIEQIEELEKNPDQLMAATNAAYVEAMEAVREVEVEMKTLDDKLKLLEGKQDESSNQQRTTLQDQRAGVLARLETLQADSVFFAAEAYHSKGPFQHIVQAGQKSAQQVKADPSIKPEDQNAAIGRAVAERLKALPLTAFMQSLNEQLGDFLKDLKHYDEKSPFPGLGLYRSSKYLERFCEAMDWIGKKLDAEETMRPAAEAFHEITIAGKTPAAVKGALAGLVNLRGGKVGFADAEDADREAEAYALAETQKIFGGGVKTLNDLGTLIKAVSKQVNVVLRQAEVAQKMIAESEKAYFPTAKTR